MLADYQRPKNENGSLILPKPPIAKFAQGKRGFGIAKLEQEEERSPR
jgi:hypothetical protein